MPVSGGSSSRVNAIGTLCPRKAEIGLEIRGGVSRLTVCRRPPRSHGEFVARGADYALARCMKNCGSLLRFFHASAATPPTPFVRSAR